MQDTWCGFTKGVTRHRAKSRQMTIGKSRISTNMIYKRMILKSKNTCNENEAVKQEEVRTDQKKLEKRSFDPT